MKKSTIYLLINLLFAGALYAQSSFDEGVRLYKEGKYQEAIAKYDEYISSKPNAGINTYYNRGLAYYELKNYVASAEDFAQVYNDNPTDVDAGYYYAYSLYKLGDYDECIEIADAVLNDDPEYVNMMIIEALAFQGIDRHEEAISVLNQAEKIEPTNDLVYYNRAISYQALGEYSDAIADNKMAIELDPENANAWWGLGDAYYASNQTTEALNAYRKQEALEEIPSSDAKNNIGRCYYSLYQDEEAQKYYEKAIEIDPDVQVYHYNIGLLKSEQKKYKESIPYYEKALQLDSNYYKARFELGIALMKTGKYTQASTQLTKVKGQGDDEFNEKVETQLKKAEKGVFLKKNLLPLFGIVVLSILGIFLFRKLRKNAQEYNQGYNRSA